MVPVDSLFETERGPVVFRAVGDKYQEVAVVLGKRNERVAVVQGEIRLGDMVARERPPSRPALRVEGTR